MKNPFIFKKIIQRIKKERKFKKIKFIIFLLTLRTERDLIHHIEIKGLNESILLYLNLHFFDKIKDDNIY